jgi:hypothetical protein
VIAVHEDDRKTLLAPSGLGFRRSSGGSRCILSVQRGSSSSDGVGESAGIIMDQLSSEALDAMNERAAGECARGENIG